MANSPPTPGRTANRLSILNALALALSIFDQYESQEQNEHKPTTLLNVCSLRVWDTPSDDFKVTRNRLSVGRVYPAMIKAVIVLTNRTCLWMMTRCLIEEVQTESVSIPRDLEE